MFELGEKMRITWLKEACHLRRDVHQSHATPARVNIDALVYVRQMHVKKKNHISPLHKLSKGL